MAAGALASLLASRIETARPAAAAAESAMVAVAAANRDVASGGGGCTQQADQGAGGDQGEGEVARPAGRQFGTERRGDLAGLAELG